MDGSWQCFTHMSSYSPSTTPAKSRGNLLISCKASLRSSEPRFVRSSLLFWLMDYPWINCGLSLWWVKYILWLPELIAGAINWKISNNSHQKNHQTYSKTENSMQKNTSKTSQKHVFFGYPWICKKDPIKTEAHHPNLHVDDSQHHLRPGGTLNGGNLTISKLQIWLYVCIYIYICIDWIVLIVTLWELELHIINYIIRIVCVHYIIYRLIETHI